MRRLKVYPDTSVVSNQYPLHISQRFCVLSELLLRCPPIHNPGKESI